MRRILERFMFVVFVFIFSGCTESDPDGQQPYRYESYMTVDGVVRTYVVKLPETYYDNNIDQGKYPLVIALHGTGGSAYQMEASYGLNEKGAKENFIIAYPEGVSSSGILGIRTWNAGRCCDYAMVNDIDDVGFIRDLIDWLIADFAVNPNRVYVTGMSNGGMMAYRLACELSDKIAAIAPVSATMMTGDCKPGRAVPVLHMHSLLDTKVPYNGGKGIGGYHFTPVDSVLNFWSVQNGCSASPKLIDNGEYRSTNWNDCSPNASLESYVTYDGGHAWPGGQKPSPGADTPSTYINANDLLWEFFQRFELPK
ncbi:MAG TPA: PHB depolymerase family esterase [Chryseolinea sp.]